MTEKKLYSKDNGRRRSVRDSAASLANNLAGLARAWNAFGYGQFSIQYLTGALQASPRTVSSGEPSGCKSCPGMLTFSSGQSYIEEHLLDQAGPNVTFGGVKLSRQKLRDMLELPDTQLIEDFDKYLKWVRKAEDYLPLVAFDDDTQTAAILEEAIEAHCAQYDLYLRPEKAPLLEKAQKLLDDFYALNAELAGSNGKGPLRLSAPSGFGYEPFTESSDGKVIVNGRWIENSICFPIPQ